MIARRILWLSRRLRRGFFLQGITSLMLVPPSFRRCTSVRTFMPYPPCFSCPLRHLRHCQQPGQLFNVHHVLPSSLAPAPPP